ncbi:MAG: peptidase U32 [Clostridiales bacterium]|nr:MAG: peptidase U32 [Clostridiales bacterium]
MNKVELLAPAGDLEKLVFAVDYGADAVYIGGEVFGLRTSTKNFTYEKMKEGIAYAHSKNVKVYLALNAIPHNEDIDLLEDYLKEISDLDIDAFIISDPGIFITVKQTLPNAELHLSTQANNTNYKSADFWFSQGISRVILARELSISEIVDMKSKINKDLELEVFIHGAMCMSYSGRCLLSNYMTGRDANRGSCAQPCRWKYKVVEEKRPDQSYEIEEDENGTYIFNSKDLCGITLVKQLIESGVSSLKIEGRAKSIYYVSEVVRVYREAIDTYYKDPENFKVKQKWIDELTTVSHREYTTGFLLKKPDENSHLYNSSAYVRNYDFVGVVLEYDENTGLALVEQRNKFVLGQEVEIIGPKYKSFKIVINELYDEKMNPIDSAKRAKEKIYIRVNQKVSLRDILRVKKNDLKIKFFLRNNFI